MKPIDFKEKKAAAEGKITPRSVIENLLRAIDEGHVESVVFVTSSPDGEIRTGWSSDSHLKLLGLLKSGEMQVLQDMYE